MDPRRLQLNRALAVALRDPAVSRGFAERPPAVRTAADVQHAVALLESRLPDSPQLRDAPLAALASRLGEVHASARSAAHAQLMQAAMAIPRPLAALVALQEAVQGLPPADRGAARAGIAAHPAGPLAQVLVQALDLVEPRTEMNALRERLSSLPMADQTHVLDVLARQLLNRADLAPHDHAHLVMAHHDLAWPAHAAAGFLARVGWVPPDARQALERRARGAHGPAAASLARDGAQAP